MFAVYVGMYHVFTCSVCLLYVIAGSTSYLCPLNNSVQAVCALQLQAATSKFHTSSVCIVQAATSSYKQCVHCSVCIVQAGTSSYKQCVYCSVLQCVHCTSSYKLCVHCSVCIVQAATSSVCIAVSESCLQCVPLYVFFCVYSSMCLITCKMRCFSLVQEKQLMAMRWHHFVVGLKFCPSFLDALFVFPHRLVSKLSKVCCMATCAWLYTSLPNCFVHFVACLCSCRRSRFELHDLQAHRCLCSLSGAILLACSRRNKSAWCVMCVRRCSCSAPHFTL